MPSLARACSLHLSWSPPDQAFAYPDAGESWNNRVRDNAPSYSIPAIAAGVAFHTDAMVIDRIGELVLPIALVIGDGDSTYLGANDYMERKLPQANRKTVPGARHYVMRSHPHEVAAAVRSMSAEVGTDPVIA